MRARPSTTCMLCLALASCQGDVGGGPEDDPDAAGGSSTGGDVSGGAATTGGSAATTGGGAETTGGSETNDGTTNDGDDTGSETSGSGSETGEPAQLEVLNVQSAASHVNGDSLTIADYSVPADGILVVRGGAAGPTVESVTFDGVALTQIASHDEPDYWFAISADMYWIPVTAGQSGDIAWQYPPGGWTTRRRGMVAVTIGGADEVHSLATAWDGLGTNMGRTGPSLAEVEIATTQETIILTAFTSNGPGPSDLTGRGHTLDAFPTVPIEDFHSTRVYGGHVRVGPGTVTLGYQNNETNGWFDYILINAAFSSTR